MKHFIKFFVTTAFAIWALQGSAAATTATGRSVGFDMDHPSASCLQVDAWRFFMEAMKGDPQGLVRANSTPQLAAGLLALRNNQQAVQVYNDLMGNSPRIEVAKDFRGTGSSYTDFNVGSMTIIVNQTINVYSANAFVWAQKLSFLFNQYKVFAQGEWVLPEGTCKMTDLTVNGAFSARGISFGVSSGQ